MIRAALVVVVVLAAQPQAAPSAGEGAEEPAALAKECHRLIEESINSRDNLQKGAAVCERVVKMANAAPRDVSRSLVNLSRAHMRLGDLVRGAAAVPEYELGRQAAQAALKLNPKDDDALFWDMACLGSIGRERGMMNSLFMLPELKQGLARVLELNPDHHYARDTLAKIYAEVPGIVGGDDKKAEALFLEVLRRDPRFTPTMVSLAEFYIDEGRYGEARKLLQKVLDTPTPESSVPNDHWRFNVPDAKRALKSIEGK